MEYFDLFCSLQRFLMSLARRFVLVLADFDKVGMFWLLFSGWIVRHVLLPQVSYMALGQKNSPYRHCTKPTGFGLSFYPLACFVLLSPGHLPFPRLRRRPRRGRRARHRGARPRAAQRGPRGPQRGPGRAARGRWREERGVGGRGESYVGLGEGAGSQGRALCYFEVFLIPVPWEQIKCPNPVPR